jgi:hypothetical protein
MAEIKTKPHDGNVQDFILNFAATEQKQKDAFALLQLMREVTNQEPIMWGPSIIGFGQYHYKSERSKQEGDWLLVGFSPRKAAISLYVYSGAPGQEQLLTQLGKFKMGKGCIYVNKLTDINLEVLKQLILSTMDHLSNKFK